MSTRIKNLFRVMSLFVLVVSFIPVNQVVFAATTTPPPADMFQLPWDQGLAWVAIDGIDNTSERPASSSHNYLLGGAIDFAPHNNMITGENTSNFWVAAAAAGTVVGISSCHIILDHGNGWLTQYQFLGNIQVKLGDTVAQNQRLGIIADGVRIKYCPGSVDPNVPHLHFMLRPTMIGATFAGWLVKYNWFFNSTSFTRNGTTVGLYKPLLNAPVAQPTTTPTLAPTLTPGPGTASVTPGPGTPSATPISTQPSATATLPSSITDTPVATSTGATDTPTPTAASGPYVITVASQPNLGVGDTTTTTVSLNNVPVEGFTSAEFTCTYDATLLEASNILLGTLFGADAASIINGPQNGKFIVAIAGSHGNKDTTNGVAFTFDLKALQAGQTTINCTARVSIGSNTLTDLPSSGSALTILAETLTPTTQPLPTDTPAPTQTLAVTDTPFATLVPTQTPVPGWLTFTDATFGFQFMYPSQGQIQSGSNDSNTRINNLPIVQPGTNLTRKFMNVLVGQNVTECKSQQVQDPGVTVTINGIPFLKQTGAQGAAGSLFDLVEYSTLRDGVCVNLEFVLQSHDPSSFPTPPPVFDYATETALFDQIVATFMWLPQTPTATPDVSATPAFTATPIASPTLAVTATPTMFMSPTPSGGNGAITGQVTAGKPVTINVYDSSSVLVATAQTQPDGSFYLEVPPGNYTAIASAPGFLKAQADVASLNAGITRILPPITLLAGDIDGNNVIDQFDALTIGMNYNGTTPSAADLNGDGIINVLDLELLADNYRDTGPTVWQ